MDDVVRAAARLIELARIPWDQQSSKVKSETSKLRTGRADKYARALLAAHERIKEQAECIERLRKVVEVVRPFEPSGEWGTHMAMITNGAATREEGMAHCKVIVRAQRNLSDCLAALETKEPTDDKQRR